MKASKTLPLALLLASTTAWAEEYSQNFDGFADGTTDLGDGSFMIGNANVEPQVFDEQLRLTENTNSNNAAFHIPAMSDSSQGFTVTFDVTMTDTADGTNPADGFAVSYGASPFGTTSPLPEEGWRGIGRDMADGSDATDYVRKLRSEWESRP